LKHAVADLVIPAMDNRDAARAGGVARLFAPFLRHRAVPLQLTSRLPWSRPGRLMRKQFVLLGAVLAIAATVEVDGGVRYGARSSRGRAARGGRRHRVSPFSRRAGPVEVSMTRSMTTPSAYEVILLPQLLDAPAVDQLIVDPGALAVDRRVAGV
jgi:hypothetical protein